MSDRSKSTSYIKFFKRLNKLCMYQSFHTGFYTDDLTLSKDLKQWLKTNKLYDTCTYNCSVLLKDKMIKHTYLKEYISIEAIKPYINHLDECIHLRSGA